MQDPTPFSHKGFNSSVVEGLLHFACGYLSAADIGGVSAGKIN